jgi:hypothetical protein
MRQINSGVATKGSDVKKKGHFFLALGIRRPRVDGTYAEQLMDQMNSQKNKRKTNLQ